MESGNQQKHFKRMFSGYHKAFSLDKYKDDYENMRTIFWTLYEDLYLFFNKHGWVDKLYPLPKDWLKCFKNTSRSNVCCIIVADPEIGKTNGTSWGIQGRNLTERQVGIINMLRAAHKSKATLEASFKRFSPSFINLSLQGVMLLPSAPLAIKLQPKNQPGYWQQFTTFLVDFLRSILGSIPILNCSKLVDFGGSKEFTLDYIPRKNFMVEYGDNQSSAATKDLAVLQAFFHEVDLYCTDNGRQKSIQWD